MIHRNLRWVQTFPWKSVLHISHEVQTVYSYFISEGCSRHRTRTVPISLIMDFEEKVRFDGKRTKKLMSLVREQTRSKQTQTTTKVQWSKKSRVWSYMFFFLFRISWVVIKQWTQGFSDRSDGGNQVESIWIQTKYLLPKIDMKRLFIPFIQMK